MENKRDITYGIAALLLSAATCYILFMTNMGYDQKLLTTAVLAFVTEVCLWKLSDSFMMN